jgi:hypothetical protein
LLRAPESFLGVQLESERSLSALLTRSGDMDRDAIGRIARILASGLPAKQSGDT